MIYTDGIHVISSNSIDELHHFCVDLVGLKREWFQDHPRHPHYDTTAQSTKRKALRMGAKKVRKEEISIRINAFVKRPLDCTDITDCVCRNCGPYPHYLFPEDRYDCARCGEHVNVWHAEFREFKYVKPCSGGNKAR